MTSASQWKRCFTNPDSWAKWDIFSALFLGLELAGSLQPHIQGHPTPHLSVTHGKQEKRGFSCKNVVAFWACHVWQSQTLPESQGLLQRLTHKDLIHFCPMGILLGFGSSQGKAANPSSKFRRHHKRPLKRQSGSHSTPHALAHPGLGSSPLWQGNPTPSFFPVQKCWE